MYKYQSTVLQPSPAAVTPAAARTAAGPPSDASTAADTAIGGAAAPSYLHIVQVCQHRNVFASIHSPLHALGQQSSEALHVVPVGGLAAAPVVPAAAAAAAAAGQAAVLRCEKDLLGTEGYTLWRVSDCCQHNVHLGVISR
jgi:hypothetical protein